MQGVSASCHGLRGRDPDPGPQHDAAQQQQHPSPVTPSPFPPINRPSIALDLYNRFVNTQSNIDMETDETEDDATMTVITPDEQSSIPTQPFFPDELLSNDIVDLKVRKRGNLSPIADISKQSKKISTRSNSDVRPVSSVVRPASVPELPLRKPAPNAILMFRYHSRDRPPFVVQVQSLQESDSTNLHPLHISRILSQIYPKDMLEIKKIGRNRILAQMCTYEAANKLLEDKSLAARNLKAFVPTHKILRVGVIRDVPQDFHRVAQRVNFLPS